MAEFRLETERLVLREWRESDRATFAAIVNTPAMMRYFGDLMTAAECDAFLDRRIEDQARHGMSYWAVALRTSGALIGTCGVRIADNYPVGVPVAGMIEAGWRIGEAWWGQGYAPEAARAAIDWVWANRDADLDGAWTTFPNLPSQRVMEKLGMMRRPDLDFEHPAIPQGSALRPHLVYVEARPT